MSDAINPDHYKRLPAEAIEIIEAMIAGAPDNKAAYLHGQGAKYDLRLWGKGKSLEDFLTDWQKHIWYALRLERHLIELVETQRANEQQKASDLQSLKDHPFGKPEQPAWIPKIGDWVRITKPCGTHSTATVWFEVMDHYDGKVFQVAEIEDGAIVHDQLGFLFDWLEPAEQPAWTPKIGDWVRIKKPSDAHPIAPLWFGEMDWYDGQIIRVKEIVGDGVVHDQWGFCFEWLEPVNQPKARAISDKIPEGYRKLGDSSIEPRDLEDLRWSVSEKRYVEITIDEIGYANRDNWAACRKVEPVVKQSLTLEPPDGWRWLEVGEVIRKGDKGFEKGLVHAIDSLIGMALQAHWRPTIRRNRFEVGEKVVRISNGVVYKVIRILSMGYQLESEFCAEVILHAKVIAPYIEETK